MLSIYNFNNPSDRVPLPIEDDKRFITHRYDGYDTLTFELPNNHPLYSLIVEEVKVEDEKNRYVVKTIDEHSDFVTVMCDLDLDDWKRDIIYEYRRTNAILQEVLEEILPADWAVEFIHPTSLRTTVEQEEGNPILTATPLEILPKVASAYNRVFNFDVIHKVVSVIDPAAYQPSGQFFTDELNLKSLGYVGTSGGFATRLYAYGKKGKDGSPLTISMVNDGKPYVEDYSYSNKVISVGWSDERYTDAESLKAAAIERLKLVSAPSRSYTCEAQNLQEDVWVYKVVTLIDRRHRTRVNHQIVEYKEYPDHVLDSITLSKAAPSITTSVDKVIEETQNNLLKESANLQAVLQQSVEDATERITGNKGGNFLWIFDSEGRPTELAILADSLDINTAKTVWRWNSAGLGVSKEGYSGDLLMAILANGSINATAITAGILTANILRAGRISDLKGRNFWDLETGDFSLSADTLVKNGDSETQLKDFVEGSLTQEMTFNALTNGGVDQGIFLRNGKLYINTEYLSAGKVNAEDIGLKGLFEVWFVAPSTQREYLGGYIGYMSGSAGHITVTDGIALMNAQKDCYFIATDAGCRVQAGTSNMYLGKDGDCVIEASVQVRGDLTVTGAIVDETN